MLKSSKAFHNAKWIVVCKVAQAALQLVISMLCARYLGPSNYGLISYVSSIVAFVMPLMQLGLRSTLVQELIDAPEREGEILGTSIVMELISGVACIIMVCSFVFVCNPGETQTLIVCALYSISLIFHALEIIELWFHRHLKSKFPSIMMLVAYLVISAYKAFLLIKGKNICWFAVSNSIEYAVVSISLIVIYRRMSGQRMSFSFAMGKRLFARSKYYILAAMMVTVFQNTDHIMLKTMAGDIENGLYTAAVSTACACRFLYTAIIDSMRPVILSHKKDGRGDYEKLISRLYFITIYLAVFQSVGFTVFAKLIIQILYGSQYMEAVPLLQIVVWYVAFSYMGSVRDVWILAEGKQAHLWKINMIGATTNCVINAFLIPQWGAAGAACASLMTQIFTNFILGFVYAPLKENNRLLLAGLNPRQALDLAVSFFAQQKKKAKKVYQK